jgi:hypothetical protein
LRLILGAFCEHRSANQRHTVHSPPESRPLKVRVWVVAVAVRLTEYSLLWGGKRPSALRRHARRRGAGHLAPASRPPDPALDWWAAVDSEERGFGAGGHGCSSA